MKICIKCNKKFKPKSSQNTNYYCGRICYFKDIKGKPKKLLMHRLIMNTPQGMDTDHINHNKLDNKRSNLRICTTSQNMMNTCLSSKNTSGFKGVFWDKRNKKWGAHIGYKKKTLYLGIFKNKINAAKAYNLKALELFKDFACLNKI